MIRCYNADYADMLPPRYYAAVIDYLLLYIALYTPRRHLMRCRHISPRVAADAFSSISLMLSTALFL